MYIFLKKCNNCDETQICENKMLLWMVWKVLEVLHNKFNREGHY